jgi:NAD+ kinase
VKVATVLTHRRPAETREALVLLCRLAAEAGYELRFDETETRKHDLPTTGPIVPNADVHPNADLALVLGGDGTVLTALGQYAGTGVPVFGVNFGEVGFLATVDRDEIEPGLRRAFAGDFEKLPLPAIEVMRDGRRWLAMNDVSLHRKPGLRVADLSYSVGPDEVGRVRCDGLVVATPAGSTGYNLANGGPVMAWGVEGFVVSFIAPHSLTARSLVVAPSDSLVIANRSPEEQADVTVDGRPVWELGPGEAIEARFVPGCGTLAQLPGATFYHRLREKFGRLATGV